MSEPSLEQYQNLFTENLLTEHLSSKDAEDLLSHLIPMFDDAEDGKEALERLKIYRNNVILSLSVAVGDTFPVIKRLIGDDCFNAAAIEFVRKHPPKQASLLFYGEEFIPFIKDFPSCTELGYLTDVAQLEWSYIRAFHAQDAPLLDPESLQQIAPETLADVILTLHPSVQLMQSDWPVDVIWQENLEQEVASINLQHHSGCNLLIHRQQLQVQLINLTDECFNLLQALAQGKSIADAWSATLHQQQASNKGEIDASELPTMLSYLLRLALFTSAIVPTSSKT